MKCLKNSKTGNIIRIDDRQADQMTGSTWSYVAKSEWKSLTRKPITEQQETPMIHEIQHLLGICGEKHLSLMAVLLEWPSLNHMFTYIKTYIK